MRIRMTIAALTTALVSTTTAASCAGGSAGGGGDHNDSAGRYDCAVIMIGPKLSDSGAITGGAQITCVEPPASHHAGLYLEYHSAASTRWQLENADKSSEIRVLAVIADCRVGDWRLRYQATGLDATGKPFDVAQTNAEVFIHSCPH